MVKIFNSSYEKEVSYVGLELGTKAPFVCSVAGWQEDTKFPKKESEWPGYPWWEDLEGWG